MMSDWRSRATPVTKEGSSNNWRSRASAITPPAEQVSEDDPTQSKVAAAAAGVMNPVGLADEMGAAGSTALNAITGFSGPLAGGNLQDLVDEYRQKRDANRIELAKIQAANPKTYAAGRLAGGVVAGGLAGVPQSLSGAVLQGTALGGLGGLGESNADLTRGEYGQAAIDTSKGMGIGFLGGAAGYGAGKLISSGLNGDLAKGLKNFAEKNAVKATGATGKQISKFDENAGRELLDRKIVSFGDTPENIANKAQSGIEAAEGTIDKSLSELDKSGVVVKSNDVINQIENKISSLKKDPSQADVVRKLQGIVEDIKNTRQEEVNLSAAEQTKRGFNRIARNWQDPEKGQAGKTAYLAYRDAVESSAQAANPKVAEAFKGAKESYGLLNPIQEAAERRASTLQQSPVGGLLDVSAAGAGFLKGGPVGMVVAPIARRVIAPRAASMIAVSSDKLANLLAGSPQSFGKYASILQSAASRGGQALAETNLILQKDPEYLQILNSVASNDGPSTPPVQNIAGMQSMSDQDRSPSSNLKGEAKWANDGLKNLGLSDDSLLQDGKSRSLLIEASGLKPGSKRFEQIKNQLSQGRGNK